MLIRACAYSYSQNHISHVLSDCLDELEHQKKIGKKQKKKKLTRVRELSLIHI